MCTQCFVPTRPQWALPNSQVVPQVRNIFFSHSAVTYAWVGIRVMGCSYNPFACDPSSPSIKNLLGTLTHRFVI